MPTPNSDLLSMRVGIPTQNGFLSLTMDYLAKQTGMALKRVEHALADLKASGLVTFKTISHRLFAILGLDRILKKERAKTEKRFLKWQRNRDRGADEARRALAMNTLNMNKRVPPPESPEYTRYTEYKRHLNIKR